MLQKTCLLLLFLFHLYPFTPSFAATSPKGCEWLLRLDAHALPQTRHEMIQKMAEIFDAKEYAIQEFGKIRGLSLLESLEEFGPGYSHLIFDVGVMARAKDFLNFSQELKQNGKLPKSYLKTRELFSRKLGKAKFYRAITIPLRRSKKFLETDLMSRALLESNFEGLAIGHKKGIWHRFGKTTRESLKLNPFISLSNFPDLAVSVADDRNFGGTRDDFPHLLLFELELPVLDVVGISFDAYPGLPPSIRFIAKKIRHHLKVIHSDKKINVYPFDARVESFVFYKIEPTEVKNVYFIPRGDGLPAWGPKPFGKEQVQLSAEEYLDSITAADSRH